MNTYKMYVIDSDHRNGWLEQEVEYYIYSNKVHIFKKIIENVIGVMLVIFLFLVVLTIWGYCKSKKKLKMSQVNKSI